MNKYILVFDKLIIKQLKKSDKNMQNIISKMLDKLELIGPLAGNLLDSKRHLYEIKNKHPPIRLYFKCNVSTEEICVFEYGLKHSSKEQQKTINKLKLKT